MSFLGFSTFSNIGQHHVHELSPQRIGFYQPHHQQQLPEGGALIHQQPDATAVQQQPLSGADEVKRLAKEYQEEAARLSEQLSLCGITQQSLSLEALDSLKLLAQLACVLDVTQASPQALLAAWAMLLVKQSKGVMLQRKLRRELAAIKQKRATAQHKLVVLQKLLVDVQAGQQKEAKQAANYSKMTRQVLEKDASYKAQIEKMGHKLEKSGFSQEITHSALLEKHSELQGLQARLRELQQQLGRFHELPASLLGARMRLEEARKQLEERQTRFKELTVE